MYMKQLAYYTDVEAKLQKELIDSVAEGALTKTKPAHGLAWPPTRAWQRHG